MRGRDLRALRKEKGVTQSALRQKLGWNIDRLVAIENERVLPLPEDEERIILAINQLSQSTEVAA